MNVGEGEELRSSLKKADETNKEQETQGTSRETSMGSTEVFV